MADIDEERLQMLMELVNKEHPDLDPYVIWVLCVNQLLNEQGLFVLVVEQIREKRKQESGYSIRVI